MQWGQVNDLNVEAEIQFTPGAARGEHSDSTFNGQCETGMVRQGHAMSAGAAPVATENRTSLGGAQGLPRQGMPPKG